VGVDIPDSGDYGETERKPDDPVGVATSFEEGRTSSSLEAAMVLITCPECKNKISDTASSCPKCGRPLTPVEAAKLRKLEQTSSIIAAIVVAASVLFIVISVLSSTKTNRDTSSKTKRDTLTEANGKTPAITYQTINEWRIPNGGYGRVIVINPSNCNDADMRALGKQLRNETRLDRNAFVVIYDDLRAARLRNAALAERLSQKELEYHDKHLIGSYMRNASTGFHQLVFGFSGIHGPQTIVDY
jgi:hypothetical protein